MRNIGDANINLEHIKGKVQSHQRRLLGEEHYYKNSVLVPLIQTRKDRLAVLFEKRASTLNRQSGEICFPGGHWEEDDPNEWETALRETCEELRIAKHSVEYVGQLDLLLTHAQLLIYPFVGFILTPQEQINPNPQEVDHIFSVDLELLLTATPKCYEATIKVQPAEDFPYDLIPNGHNYSWRAGKVPQYFYEFDGHVIWGMTARILFHFLQIIRRT